MVGGLMNRLLTFVYKLDISFHFVSGVVLAIMMLVTLTDITMRAFGKPLIGGIEIICFAGAVLVGFALPYSSWKGSHIYVDMLTAKISPRSQIFLGFFTKSIGALLFLFLGINFILYGFNLIRTGEVSPGFRIPYYPISFGLALASFLESLTLLCDVLKIAGGKGHE
jgi:TRAP-type C4-dicarboxylate transport system permease small subunit